MPRSRRAAALRITLDGAAHRLTPLPDAPATRPLLRWEPPRGAVIPDYLTRRALLRAATRAQPGAVLLFPDPLRGLWRSSWSELCQGVAVPAEATGDGSAPASDAPHHLRVLRSVHPPEEPLPPWCPAPAVLADAAQAIVPALARRITHAARARGAAEPLPTEADALALRNTLVAATEHSAHPGWTRAVWQSLAEFAVLDPRCGEGARLLAVISLLEPLYLTCLARMRGWLDDAELQRERRRPERLADFRAVLAQSDDIARHPSPRHFVRAMLIRRLLHGIEPDSAALAAARDALLAALADAGATPAASDPPVPWLCVGDGTAGVQDHEQLRRVLARAHLGSADAGTILEQLRILEMGARHVIAEEEASGATATAARRELRRQQDALAARLDAALALADGLRAGIAPAVHPVVEFAHGGEGGFASVLGAPPRAAVRERRDYAGVCARRSAPAPARVRDEPASFGAEPMPKPALGAEPVVIIPRDDPGYPRRLHARLDDAAPEVLTLCGARARLAAALPSVAFFGSRRVPAHLALRTYAVVRALRDAGSAALLGGFHAPLERECLDLLLLAGTAPVLVCPARSIDPPFRVPPSWRAATAEGRLTLLSPFAPGQRRASREMARIRNDLVAALADRIFIPHADPSGTLFSLARRALGWGVPVHTLEDDANTDLILLGATPLPHGREAEALAAGR